MKEVKWIPARISLPKANKIYNITYHGINGKSYTDSAIYNPDKNRWYWDELEECEVNITVIAWSDLPDPYNEERFMYGAIIGDIVGSIYEFHNIKTKDFLFWNPKCYFTDDTVMTIAVYNAIASYKMDPSKDLKRALINSMQMLGRKYRCSYGAQFKQWLYESNPKPYNSFGNGAAMRVSAAGFLADSLEEAISLAKSSAEVSHNHRYGIDGAVSIATGIFMARAGSSKEEIKGELSCIWDLNFTLDDIRERYEFDETCQGTVPQAIVAFLESDSFEDAIRNAISIGGDSDTLAAITGSLAEAYYGVPAEMKQKALEYLDNDLVSIILKCEKYY